MKDEFSDLFNEKALAYQNAQMADSIFRDGFLSQGQNPHPYPKDKDLERIELSSKKGPLTELEKLQLAAMNTVFNATPWARWSNGNYLRVRALSKGTKVSFNLGALPIVGSLINVIQAEVFAKNEAGQAVKVAKTILQVITPWGTLLNTDLKDVKLERVVFYTPDF